MTPDEAARTAAKLLEDLIDGVGRERDRAATVRRVQQLLDEARAGLEADRPVDAAMQVHRLGLLARHVEDDGPAARPLFEDAVARCVAAGASRAAWFACVQLVELDPTHDAGQLLRDAVAAGLPDDLDPDEDPRRLAFALGLSRKTDDALSCYDALVDDAVARSKGGRAASLLRDVARLEEEQKKDRKRALATLERCLALAEEAGDTAEIGAALLRLTDLHWSRGDRNRAKAHYERVAKMRGLPKWQKDQIRVGRTIFV